MGVRPAGSNQVKAKSAGLNGALDLTESELQGHQRIATPSSFEPGDYHRGRSVGWQVAWHLVQNAVFKKWWLPDPARATILRAFGAKVGTGVRIRESVYIHWPWHLSLGRNAQIGRGVSIYNLVEVTVGEEAVISQEAFVTSGSHRVSSATFAYDNRPVKIAAGAWVGARAQILAGSQIGVDAMVAAGSTVAGTVEANTVSVSVVTPRRSKRFDNPGNETSVRTGGPVA